MLILYAATAGESVVRLYAAAFFPGLGLALIYMIYVLVVAMLQPHRAPRLPLEERTVPFLQVLWALITSFVPLALLIASVLGAIILGLATPSEAAAMGAAGSVILAIVYRSMTFTKLKESTFLTARTTAMVCWLFVGSYIFTSIFGWLGGHHVVEDFVKVLNLSPVMFMLMAQAIIFLLGWPLEWTEIVLIFVPIFLPLLPVFEIDAVLFGVLVALNLQTSFLSPPVAMAAYYLKGVAPPSVKLTDIFAGCLPFVGLVLVSMLLLYIFPEIATWLPSYLYDTPQGEGSGLQLPEGGFQAEEEVRLP
jgi:tripartite ATP-independent transporter DctM subunit